MSEGKSRGGRKATKDFAAVYAGWPDIDASQVADIHDRRLLTFIHALRRAYESDPELTSFTALAAKAGIARSAMMKVLAGQAWPTMEIVSKLEVALDTDLWPRR